MLTTTNLTATLAATPESQALHSLSTQPTMDTELGTSQQNFAAAAPAEATERAGVSEDGGRAAWATIFGCWIIQFCTVGYSNAFGVYEDFYTRDFLLDNTPSEISWIGSFQLFMQYAPGILVGKILDAGYL
ncbi:hypothetical protein VNI00_011972 [Paramarasmius palmivorus]|uniref:Uncharacterized protein n=1 Tax=Paramarasmius palmivorus TaxID=297713 RepID=A0AAW0C9S2_9AGAR